MRQLSTGMPSTLGSYLSLTEAVFGRTSPAAAYLRKKIAETPMGAEEEVIADEGQMILLLSNIHSQESTAVVPLMPTPEMIDAGRALVSGSLTYAETRQVYEAMVAAAPYREAQQVQPEGPSVTPPSPSGEPSLQEAEDAIRAFERSGWHGSKGHHSGLIAAANLLRELREKGRKTGEPRHD